jgi:peptide/nickel transport system substrate-binding protein
VGTGSVVIADWENRNGAVELRENEFSWRPPKLSRIEVYPLTDHAARIMAALSRQLEIVGQIRPENKIHLEGRGFEVRADPVKQVISLAFDVEGHPDSPLKDVRVRRAINYAVDKETISDLITYDTQRPAGQGAAPGTYGYNPDVFPYPHDPGKARELLAEAGFPDGLSFKALVVLGTYANDVEIYQRVQQDLADVGIDITIESTAFPDWLRQYVYNDWRSEAFSIAWNSAPYNDAIRPMEYFSCGKSRPFFCDQAMYRDIQAAALELDPAVRLRQLQSLQQQFHAQAPCLFLLEFGHLWAYSRSLSGFQLRNRVVQLHEISYRSAGLP